jgi:dipeptidyl-peptidase-4
MHRILNFTLILCLFLTTGHTFAQDKLLTIDDIYDPQKKVNFNGSPPLDLLWLPDGNQFLQRKKDAKTGDTTLWKISAATGEAMPFYDSATMQGAFAKLPGFTPDAAKEIANQGRYQMNTAASAALINHAHDLFYYQFGSDVALRLTHSPEEEVGEEFSPDGKFVSFVRNYNLFVVDVATQHERALTHDGGPELFNAPIQRRLCICNWTNRP